MVQFRTLTAALSVALLITACSASTKQKLTGEMPSPYRTSAEAGDAEAQYQLGLAYAANTGSGKHRGYAIYWLCSAAVQGHASAQYELGQLYADSLTAREGELANRSSAYFWFTAAASQGKLEALDARAMLAKDMQPATILEAKQRATHWAQAQCGKP